MDILINFFKSGILIPFFLILFATFLFSILCELIITSSITFYFWIQNILIVNSSSSNKLIISKLIIIFYKIHKIIISFFVRIRPFQFKSYESSETFHPRLCTTKSKRNIISILICFGITMVINFVLNNINIFKKAYLWFLDEQIAKNILTFISENKWMLLTTFGVVFLVYEVLKDRFTNKIISEIHDEELKNIIITHKELFMDFITLRNTLCFNINHFFDTLKENGIIYHIHMSITEKSPSFEFDSVHRSFKKKECQNLYSPLNAGTYGYKNIADILNKMKIRIEEFKNTNPFYNTSAINKYVRGLQGFDISRAIKENDINHLLCEEFIKSLYELYPEHITEFITNSNFDDESKIIKLNELLDSGNYLAADTVLKTIEYTIDIETYIYKFSKAFALKTRRKELSFEQILDKYK